MIERHKLITCILPSGRALEVLELLRAEYGLPSAYAHHAREVTFRPGEDLADESELVTVLVPEARAEEIFEVLRATLALDAPGSGLVMMERTRLARASAAPTVPDAPAA
ncbi:MAG TPA: hypothetical protein VIS77_09225 [Burkholderiales bacterium]